MMATLHLMVGLPCSGKTTLAKRLENELGALRLTPDDWHRRLFGQDAEHADHDARHSQIEAIQWEIASAILKQGVDVILDFGLWSRMERDDFKQRALDIGATSRIHFCDAPFVDLLARLEQRNTQSPETTTHIPPALMQSYLERFEAPDKSELRGAE